MNTQTKLFTVIGIATILVATLAIGGWIFSTAFAQGPWQGGNWSAMHNNQAVLAMLKANESRLLQERQAGKSWRDIAAAQGVSEQALTDALLQPMTQTQSWMTQNYPQVNTAQMTEWMREQIAQDLRVTQYGTMTDMHVFNGSMMNAMMGGNGMIGSGMMNGGMMRGMMNGSFNTPNVNATPVPATQKIDRQVNLTAFSSKFAPATVAVNQGETVKFTIVNQDKFAHNVVSLDGKLAYTVLPANQTTSVVWSAPNQTGTFTVICTWHPGMQLTIEVE